MKKNKIKEHGFQHLSVCVSVPNPNPITLNRSPDPNPNLNPSSNPSALPYNPYNPNLGTEAILP